jgi:glycogen debranching enzyme
MVDGLQARNHWYVVADLGATPAEIVRQAADFSNACSRARTSAGGGKSVENKEEANASRPTYGMDEKGRITKRTTRGGTTEVRELQGFVYAALKRSSARSSGSPSVTDTALTP